MHVQMRENRSSHLVGRKTHPTIYCPSRGSNSRSSAHSIFSNMVKVSNALTDSATAAIYASDCVRACINVIFSENEAFGKCTFPWVSPSPPARQTVQRIFYSFRAGAPSRACLVLAFRRFVQVDPMVKTNSRPAEYTVLYRPRERFDSANI